MECGSVCSLKVKLKACLYLILPDLQKSLRLLERFHVTPVRPCRSASENEDEIEAASATTVTREK